MTRQEKAIKDMEEMIEDYKWTHDRDSSMLKMYREDRKDFREIVSFMKEGKWDKAYKKAYYLDTAVRDCIPYSSWGLMEYLAEIV